MIGPVVFLAAMWAVFETTTTVAAPLQGLLDRFFSGPVTDAAGGLVDTVGLGCGVDGAAGCGATGPSSRRGGPVLVALSLAAPAPADGTSVA